MEKFLYRIPAKTDEKADKLRYMLDDHREGEELLMIFRLFFSFPIHLLQISQKKLKLTRFQIGILIKIYI